MEAWQNDFYEEDFDEILDSVKLLKDNDLTEKVKKLR